MLTLYSLRLFTMGELIIGVNWVAVIVGAVAAYALGAAWYSKALFGTRWIEGSRITPGAGSMGHAMITQAVGTFLLAWLIGITARENMLLTAILIAVTIAALIKAGGLFGQKNMYVVVVESTFVLAMVFVMIVVHVVL
jgi:hypothetical protein